MDSFEQIMDRAQKLTAALYRVTDILSDKEPLKWALRERSINIYNNLLVVKKNNSVLGIIFEDLSCIIKNLELIAVGSYISNLNFEILKREYFNLKILIEGENLSDISIGHLIGHSETPSLSITKSSSNNSVPETKERKNAILNNGHNKGNGTERKKKIIDFLKNNGSKTISEIIPIFGEINEKSVQRDLLDLVRSGQIMASGEKRWRKYNFI